MSTNVPTEYQENSIEYVPKVEVTLEQGVKKILSCLLTVYPNWTILSTIEVDREVATMPQSLKQICREHGTSLTALGRKIGKSKQYMSELARGNIRLRYDMAVRIALALNTTPDSLFLPKQSNLDRPEQEPPTTEVR